MDSLHLQLFLANTMTKTLIVCSTYCKIIPTDTESKVRVIDVGEIDPSTTMFFFFCVCVCVLLHFLRRNHSAPALSLSQDVRQSE